LELGLRASASPKSDFLSTGVTTTRVRCNASSDCVRSRVGP
jgi:hypothetical protein